MKSNWVKMTRNKRNQLIFDFYYNTDIVTLFQEIEKDYYIKIPAEDYENALDDNNNFFRIIISEIVNVCILRAEADSYNYFKNILEAIAEQEDDGSIVLL